MSALGEGPRAAGIDVARMTPAADDPMRRVSREVAEAAA